MISQAFRIYITNDVVGVETCGAVKNIIAVTCGITSGAGLGDNTLALDHDPRPRRDQPPRTCSRR